MKARRTPGVALPALSSLRLDAAPMEARSAHALPNQPGEWQFEPKWDGFRCLAFKEGSVVELKGKSGTSLGRFFPEVVATLLDVPFERFAVDGELVIELNGRLTFDALQARLHPAASRIRRLSVESPARLILFDMLIGPNGSDVRALPFTDRRTALEALGKKASIAGKLIVTPGTRDLAQATEWLDDFNRDGRDGVVAKRLDGKYLSGERAMIKVKRFRTADCVVGGFRYQNGSREVGSLLLGLYNPQGQLDHVGFSSTIANDERPALTRKLHALRAPPGFTGKAPGGPSRWSSERSGEWEPLRPKLVVEVRYDHVTGNRFRHGTKLLRFRPDKPPQQCSIEQIIAPPLRSLRRGGAELT
jgi:ATP-dependent DNA ligase